MQDYIILLAVGAFSIYVTVWTFLISGFLRLKNHKAQFRPTVSVVVAARNEEDNLAACLYSLMNQSYPKKLTEIVLINDRSTDSTAKILAQFQSHNRCILEVKVKNTPPNTSPKKFALSQGIAQASGEVIFTTDADCTPPPEWISETVPLFDDDVGIVVGLAPFEAHRSLVGQLLALDNLATAFVSSGASGWNIGVTCTGRNLAYRRSIFEKLHGFQHINHSLSGDDDLFLQLVKKLTHWRVNYSLNPETAVPSQAAATFSEFIRQRRRHVSAAKYYSKRLQLAYFLFNFSNLILFAFLLLPIFYQVYFREAILLFCAKLILDFIAIFLIARKINRRKLLFLFPLWEIFFVAYQTFISPLGFIGKIKWKP